MATLNLQVAASSDDCVVTHQADYFALTNPYAQAGYCDSSYNWIGIGMRFLNAAIPQGATITTAYLTLRCNSSSSQTTVNTRIKGEAADDAATFSDQTDFDGRTRTSAYIDWDNIAAWTSGTDYASPEIKTVIQEIINRAGWASGNALVIFWDDFDGRSTQVNNTRRYAHSYDGSATYAPKLHIEYTSATEKLSSDSGTGTDTKSDYPSAALTGPDTGSGVDAKSDYPSVEQVDSDSGSGLEIGGLLKGLFGQDEGRGLDNIRILTSKAGYDLRLHSHQGQVGIPHKEVRL